MSQGLILESDSAPVQVGPSVIAIRRCANGCPPTDLYVIVQSNKSDALYNPLVCVGCSFCGQKIHRAKVTSAIEAWRHLQDLKTP